MAIAIVPEKRWPYILKADLSRPAEEQTTFHLKALSRMELTTIKQARDEGKEILAYQLALERGLVGWDNLRHPETGAPVPFDKGENGANVKNLEWINPDDWYELATAIIERQTLTEAERKNLSSPVT